MSNDTKGNDMSIEWDIKRQITDAEALVAFQRDGNRAAWPKADEATTWGNEGDESVRWCDECDRPRLGMFGEFFPYEQTTRDYPGGAACTSWVCAECEQAYDCEIADGW